VRQGVTPVFIGIAVGLGLCVLAGRALESQLFEVTRLDPISLALTGVMFLGISLLACLVPARRSARVDPLTALRE
jgi:ABC-type antimicrobial peptide transport system permease subunit